MLTQKPIATISYNSEKFLVGVLDALLKSKRIEFYTYIPHKGEYDEITKHQDKDHIHVFIIPNGRLDTVELLDNFVEITPEHEKPLRCINFVSSRFDAWYLYSIHDRDYLNTLHEKRQYEYDISECRFSDEANFRQLVFETYHSSDITLNMRLSQALKSGMNFKSLARSGHITLSKSSQYLSFRNLYYGDQNENTKEE